MYTIGQVSDLFNLPISTLRYYDKEGFFPNMERSSGIRKFSDHEIETLKLIECLKKTGLGIKEIRQFMELCAQGKDTYFQRKEFFEHRKELMEQEMKRMEKVMDMIKFKCWYYEQAIEYGDEEHVLAMYPDKFPENIQKLYDNSHSL